MASVTSSSRSSPEGPFIRAARNCVVMPWDATGIYTTLLLPGTELDDWDRWPCLSGNPHIGKRAVEGRGCCGHLCPC